MPWMIVLLSLAMEAPRAEQNAVPEGVQLALTLAPDEHVCDFPDGTRQWQDASDPFLFATGPTARHDGQELWAMSLAPLVSLRYADGRLHFVTVGVPLGTPPTAVEFTVRGWRPKWPLC